MSLIKPQNDYINSLLNNASNSNKSTNGLEGLVKASQEADQKALENSRVLSNPSDFFSPSSQGLQAVSGSTQYQQSYAYSQTMTMQIQTQEGDTVQVDFRQLYAQYQSYKNEFRQEDSPSGARYFESTEEMEATAFEERFGFAVQGDLNEEELNAIFDVFDKVSDLSNEFFNGDIEKAFAKAQELDIDFGQIQSFNLDMQKTEVYAANYQQTQAYEGVQNTDANTGEEATGQVSQLPPYIQKMQDAVDRLDAFFENAREKFDEWMADSLAQRAGEEDQVSSWYDRVKAFHDQLADASGLDKVTLKPSGIEVPVGPSFESENEGAGATQDTE
ncbi:hypothetical protein AVO42_09955 [Thiomicrospira sp. XS5]|uniref:hypothetical protein n=1 Tax=Thiomicrospira sp. XS5 TaxID=1775636 RepID=UPI00074651D1|nr:hypothetical protein [Thiomicrospira sp. XS5]KUJ75615.1 hypothetical protein AVO42_09955 [Thiomicrospira sp. XS5]